MKQVTWGNIKTQLNRMDSMQLSQPAIVYQATEQKVIKIRCLGHSDSMPPIEDNTFILLALEEQSK